MVWLNIGSGRGDHQTRAGAFGSAARGLVVICDSGDPVMVTHHPARDGSRVDDLTSDTLLVGTRMDDGEDIN